MNPLKIFIVDDNQDFAVDPQGLLDAIKLIGPEGASALQILLPGDYGYG